MDSAPNIEGLPKNQHYVPQFLLKNFANEKKQVFVFDKSKLIQYLSNVRNLASENYFYNIEIDGIRGSLEEYLADLEGHTKPIIDKLIMTTTLSCLSKTEKEIICEFIAIQYIRTLGFKNMVSCAIEEIVNRINKNTEYHLSLDKIGQKYTSEMPNDKTVPKVIMLKFIQQGKKDLAPYFQKDKVWVLAETSKDCPFVISDNPIALCNSTDSTHLGNLGLMSKGIQINFPISPTRALLIWDSSILEDIIKTVDLYKLHLANGTLCPSITRHGESWLRILEVIINGGVLSFVPDNVTHFNALQIANSDKRIFSNIADFSLASKMLYDNPNVANRGMRFVIE